jgi:hypothetical protein
MNVKKPPVFADMGAFFLANRNLFLQSNCGHRHDNDKCIYLVSHHVFP